jgi:hypothetical protein
MVDAAQLHLAPAAKRAAQLRESVCQVCRHCRRIRRRHSRRGHGDTREAARVEPLEHALHGAAQVDRLAVIVMIRAVDQPKLLVARRARAEHRARVRRRHAIVGAVLDDQGWDGNARDVPQPIGGALANRPLQQKTTWRATYHVA